MAGEAPPPVSQAERIFAILEACAAAGRPLALPELAQRTGLPKSSLHRACGTLAELGALESRDGGFQIGARLFALGSLNPDLRRLRLVAMPYLHELVARSGWVANLAILAGGNALLVDEVFKVEPRLPQSRSSVFHDEVRQSKRREPSSQSHENGDHHQR